jgi:hypothetical protein
VEKKERVAELEVVRYPNHSIEESFTIAQATVAAH